MQEVAQSEVPARAFLPRVHTSAGAANVHAYVVSGQPPIESYAPWGFGGDSYDSVTVYRGCAVGEGSSGNE